MINRSWSYKMNAACRTRTVISYLGDETWQTAVNGKAFGVLGCSGGEVSNPRLNHAVVPPEMVNQPTSTTELNYSGILNLVLVYSHSSTNIIEHCYTYYPPLGQFVSLLHHEAP